MKLSRFISLFCSLVVIFPVSMMAAPANPAPVVFTQKDGSTVTIRHYGDEHYHFAKTSDGILVVGDGDGSYVYADAEGKPSSYIAKDPEKRTSAEIEFLKTLNQSEAHLKHKALNGNRFPETLPPSVIKPNALLRANKRAFSFVTGKRYFPVLLVSTSDYEAFDSLDVTNKLNKKEYHKDGHYGSMRDYFIECSGGQFKPTFDVYPIKLPKKFKDYNKEDVLITSAIDMLVEREDFKDRAEKYEPVSPFILMHPLTNEKAATFNEYYFSHQYTLGNLINKVYSKDGYQFDRYAFVAQKDENTGKLNRLATIAHEFSHVMGLFDIYGVDSEGYATIGPLPFDLMALGTLNGDGRFPPTYSAFERESMGWMFLEEFFLDSLYRPHMLEPLSEMHAYSATNPKNGDEYYVIEYRPAVGFDSMISESEYSGIQGKNGVFIWYVNYEEYAFLSNNPNPDPGNMRIDIKQVLDSEHTYYADFTYKRSKGKSDFPGIFDLKVYGDTMVCFVLTQEDGVESCPEPKSSKKKSDLSPSQQQGPAQMHIRDGMLQVNTPVLGTKRLRIIDALGVCVLETRFEGESAQVNISARAKGPVLVLLEAGGKLLSSQFVRAR